VITGKYGDMSALELIRFLLSEMASVGYFHTPMSILEQAVARSMWAVGNTLDKTSVPFEPPEVADKVWPDDESLSHAEYIESLIEWLLERNKEKGEEGPVRTRPKELPREVSAAWAAEEFGVTTSTIYKWCQEGELRPSRVGGTDRRPRYFFNPEDVIAAAKIYHIEPRPGASSLYGDHWRTPRRKWKR
jgi:hypothetical protein